MWVELGERFCGRRGGKRLRVTIRVEILELNDDVVRWRVERRKEERLRGFADMIGFDEMRGMEDFGAEVILELRR